MSAGASFGSYPLTRIHEAFTTLYGAPNPAAPSWTPSDLSPIAWLDASQLPTAADGASLTSMNDLAAARTYSGSGFTYETNSQNTLPAIQSGGNLGYLLSPPVDIAANVPFVIWGVMQTGGTDGQLLWGTGNYQCRFNYTSNRNILMLAYTSIASANFTLEETTAWASYLIVHTADNKFNFYYNGNPRNGSTSAEVLEQLFDRLMGQSNSGSVFSNLLGEFGIALSPSTANLNSLGQYLATKWGLSWTAIA